jgi:hypothetical protein
MTSGSSPGTVAFERPLRSLPCVRFSWRVRVEYLRTTKGRVSDWTFDPHWDFDRLGVRTTRGGDGTNILTDTGPLGEILALAGARGVDVMVTLDGGVWGDAAFTDPEYDVVDELEKDTNLVQWNQVGIYALIVRGRYAMFQKKSDFFSLLPPDAILLTCVLSYSRWKCTSP